MYYVTIHKDEKEGPVRSISLTKDEGLVETLSKQEPFSIFYQSETLSVYLD